MINEQDITLDYILKYSKNFVLLAFLSIAVSGCWPFRVAMENIGRTLTNEPDSIPNKITDPIRDSVKFSALWVGHSTTLIQIDDKAIIFDPVFNDVIGAATLRSKKPGVDIKNISKLDLVLISHAHMDHMSLGSIQDLDDKFPNAKLIFPYGAEEYLPSYKMDMVRMKTGNSKELNYIGETKDFDGIKVTTIFAAHFGGRYGLDSYLWRVPGYTGYIVEYKGITILYSGDTAYDEYAYKELGKKFHINLAVIPVGPCRECDTTGSFSHVATRGALMMFDDLKADLMIPVHYGAITYFNDPRIPMYKLEEIISEEPVYKDRVKILNEGEQLVLEYKKK